MQNDLISRSSLIEELKKWADTNAMRGYDTAYDVVMDCISTVENQPIAYDVEKVVAELEDRFTEQNGIRTQYHNNAIGIALQIVRNGGKE